MLAWLLAAVGIALAATQSPWWLLLVGLVLVPKLHGRLLFSEGAWARPHYQLMRLFARAAGAESAAAEAEQRPYDIKRAVAMLVRFAHPEWSQLQIAEFILREESRRAQFADRELLAEALRRRLPKETTESLDETIENVRIKLNNPDNSTYRTLAIAGLIERRYGETVRGEYLAAVVVGDAR